MSIRLIGILILFLVCCESATGQEQDNIDGKSIYRSPNGCECFDYDCGCCQEVHWTAGYINETICVNATYLKDDYGISVTLTFNNFAVINETISARNPPPICALAEITKVIPVDICLKIYDIDFTMKRACFMVIAKVSIVKVPVLHLGCVHFPKRSGYVENWWEMITSWKTVDNNSVHEPFVTKA